MRYLSNVGNQYMSYVLRRKHNNSVTLSTMIST